MSTLQADVVVLGAGMVGVSVAVHLQKRGRQVVMIDRRHPGEETSYGNGGLVQREAVFPHPFPRSVAELRRIKEQGPERKLVAFVMEEKAVPRQGMPIDGGGEVTSGTHSPMLDVGIGMGYVPAGRAAPGTELTIDVRGRPRKARVVRKPIYEREG